MKNTIKTLTVLATFCTGFSAQGQPRKIPTSNPKLEFFFQEWERDPKPKPAMVGAVDPGTKSRVWEINLGGLSAVSFAGSPDGRFLALLIGENRADSNPRFPTGKGSENTLYLLDGATGKTLQKLEPLDKFEAAPWANATWQNLTVTFTDKAMVVSGGVFSYPKHPKPIPLKKSYPLPEIK